MITLSQGGAYLVRGTEVVLESAEAAAQIRRSLDCKWRDSNSH